MSPTKLKPVKTTGLRYWMARVLEECDHLRPSFARWRLPKKYSASTKHIVHRVGVLGWPGGLHSPEFEVERGGDAAGDLVLRGEQVARVAGETLSPQMSVGFRVDELRIDAYQVARSPNTSLPARSVRSARGRSDW